jgi:hypothetical protein
MRRLAGASDEPFAAADHPFAVLLLGMSADHARIGAAARRWLGHGEGGFHLALDHRPQPPFLLRRRAGVREQIHVAVVGRRAVDRERAEHRARRFFVDRRPSDDRQRHAGDHNPIFLAFSCTGASRASGIFSCSEKFSTSASSGSTFSSMKARVRTRNSSNSGDRVKSMGAPLLRRWTRQFIVECIA